MAARVEESRLGYAVDRWLELVEGTDRWSLYEHQPDRRDAHGRRLNPIRRFGRPNEPGFQPARALLHHLVLRIALLRNGPDVNGKVVHRPDSDLSVRQTMHRFRPRVLVAHSFPRIPAIGP